MSTNTPDFDGINAWVAGAAARSTALPTAVVLDGARQIIESWLDLDYVKLVPGDVVPLHTSAPVTYPCLLSIFEAGANFKPTTTLEQDLDAVLERAHAEHQVITVDLIPREPFAMGSYSMCGSVRDGRVS